MLESLSLEDWYGVGIGLLLVLAGLCGGRVCPQYAFTLVQKPLEEDAAKVIRALFVVAGIIVTAVDLCLFL